MQRDPARKEGSGSGWVEFHTTGRLSMDPLPWSVFCVAGKARSTLWPAIATPSAPVRPGFCSGARLAAWVHYIVVFGCIGMSRQKFHEWSN